MIVEHEVLLLLQEQKASLHFLAIFRKLRGRGIVGSYSSLSKALKSLVRRGSLTSHSVRGRGIPRKVYQIRDRNQTQFELDRERLLSDMAKANWYISHQGQIGREELPGATTLDLGPVLPTWTRWAVAFSGAPTYVQHILFDDETPIGSKLDDEFLLDTLPTLAESLFWRFAEFAAKQTRCPSERASARQKIQWLRRALGFKVMIAVELDGKRISDRMKWEQLEDYLNEEVYPVHPTKVTVNRLSRRRYPRISVTAAIDLGNGVMTH